MASFVLILFGVRLIPINASAYERLHKLSTLIDTLYFFFVTIHMLQRKIWIFC